MSETEKKLAVLAKIAGELNRQQITWAVGASLLLYLKGMANDFHDIDIMVAESDVGKVREVLISLGRLLPPNPKVQYRTKFFLEFVVDGVEIDVMAGFTIVSDGVDFYFPLEKDQIHDCAEVNGVRIPLQSVEEWREYYRLMGRTDKVERMN